MPSSTTAAGSQHMVLDCNCCCSCCDRSRHQRFQGSATSARRLAYIAKYPLTPIMPPCMFPAAEHQNCFSSVQRPESRNGTSRCSLVNVILQTCASATSDHVCCCCADATTPFAQPEPESEVESINNIEGIFPKGCQWRDIQHEGQTKKFWAVEQYEYWHGDVKEWKTDAPSTCTVRGVPANNG